jgi:hypothetical protein
MNDYNAAEESDYDDLLKLQSLSTALTEISATSSAQEKDDEGRAPAATAPSTPSNTTSTYRGGHFSPVPGSTTDEFTTPNSNNSFRLSYVTLGLTPNSMKPFGDVLDQMDADGAWDHFAVDDRDEEAILYRLIVFLYGRGYYDDLDHEKRILSIQECIKKEDGNRKRLRQIALSSTSDKVLQDVDSLNAYFYMVSTAEKFFSDTENATGGFPTRVYSRVQGGRNCYVVAACMWLTLCLQKNYPDEQPLDAGYIGRRHVINTREGLEDRVIRNTGGNAFDLVKKIVGRPADVERVNLDFSRIKTKPERMRSRLLALEDCLVGERGFGLVTCFTTSPNFFPTTAEAKTKHGYWKFDGNTVDCEGTFIELQPDCDDGIMYEKLRDEWQVQREAVALAKRNCNATMKEAIAASPRNHLSLRRALLADDDDDVMVAESIPPAVTVTGSNQSQDNGTHAMVMIGSRTETSANGMQKRFYMLWNWWSQMPLVLVSMDYLNACQCLVIFWEDVASISPSDFKGDVERNAALSCECSFPEIGENTTYNFWDDDTYDT